MAARATIVAALTTAGVRAVVSGKLSAPCVLVEPGDPWVERRSGGRPGWVSRWRLTAIAGRADSNGALAELAELVDATDTALLAVAGVQLPPWTRPADYALEGVPHAATTGIVQYPQLG